MTCDSVPGRKALSGQQTHATDARAGAGGARQQARRLVSVAMPVEEICSDCGIIRAYGDDWMGDTSDPSKCVSTEDINIKILK